MAIKIIIYEISAINIYAASFDRFLKEPLTKWIYETIYNNFNCFLKFNLLLLLFFGKNRQTDIMFNQIILYYRLEKCSQLLDTCSTNGGFGLKQTKEEEEKKKKAPRVPPIFEFPLNFDNF